MVKKFDEFTIELDEQVLVEDICATEGKNEPINESAVEIFQAVCDWASQTHQLYDGEVMTYGAMVASFAGTVALTAPIWVSLVKFFLSEKKVNFKNKKLAKAADKILADEKLKALVIDKLADDEEVAKFKEDSNYKPAGGWSKYFVETIGADVIQKMVEEIAKEAPEEVARVASAKL